MVRLNKTIFASVFAIGFGILSPTAGFTQSDTEMTAEQMVNAFKKQKTRGLVIVPSGQQNANADTTDVAAAAPPAGYSAVEKADQVNIQISFAFDSAALDDAQKVKLATLCQVMKSVDVSVFQIIGHTDSSGKASYNERLSLLRAQEVKRHLVSDCGIAENRLEAVGLGESAPFDENDPRGDVNRRVEFQALG